MELTIDQALHKAVEAHKAGQVQEADRLYTAILKVQPKHPDANHNMGVLAVSIGKVSEALPFLKTALETNPSIEQFWISYIDALIRLEKLKDAKAVLDQAKSKGAKSEGFDKLEERLRENDLEYSSITSTVKTSDTKKCNVLDNAIQLRENGKFDQAIDLIKKEIDRLTNDADLLALLSQCYLLVDQVDEAKIYLNRAKKIAPDNASVGWNTARLMLKEQKTSEALNIARATIQRFPDDVEGIGVLGACLRANGNAPESLDILNKAIELKPDYAEALINRGIIRLSQENKPEALADLELAHRLKPHIKQIWDLVIGLKVEAQEHSEAIILLQNMIKIDPKDSKRLFTLALCYQHLKDFEAAIEAYNKALAIKPNYAEAQTNLGSALKEQGKLEEAIEAYKKALAIKPDYAEAHNNMGVTLQELGKLEEAIEAYNKVLAIKPLDAEVKLNLAEALKIYSPKNNHQNPIIVLDNKIKSKHNKRPLPKIEEELAIFTLNLLSELHSADKNLYTENLQIYRRNGVDLNCKRHMQIFKEREIIPNFCFGCFKVQVDVATVLDLIRLAALFYEIEFESDLTRKCLVEVRPNISGFYKGLIYCRGIDQAHSVKAQLDIQVRDIGENLAAKIKRGCSEFPVAFPKYGEIAASEEEMLQYPRAWRALEVEFDTKSPIPPKTYTSSSLKEFCVSDYLIIQKWIDYAKGIGDPTAELFRDLPVKYDDILKLGKARAKQKC